MSHSDAPRWNPIAPVNIAGWRGHAFAVAAVAVAAGVEICLQHLLGGYAPYLLSISAIIATMAWGGNGPAFLAIALSVAAEAMLEYGFSPGKVDVAAHVSFALTIGGLLGLSLMRAYLPFRSSLVRLSPEGQIILRSRVSDKVDLLLEREAGHALYGLNVDGRIKTEARERFFYGRFELVAFLASAAEDLDAGAPGLCGFRFCHTFGVTVPATAAG